MKLPDKKIQNKVINVPQICKYKLENKRSRVFGAKIK